MLLLPMFLRSTNRKKDGKNHRYFSIVENRRLLGDKTVQLLVPKYNTRNLASFVVRKASGRECETHECGGAGRV